MHTYQSNMYKALTKNSQMLQVTLESVRTHTCTHDTHFTCIELYIKMLDYSNTLLCKPIGFFMWTYISVSPGFTSFWIIYKYEQKPPSSSLLGLNVNMINVLGEHAHDWWVDFDIINRFMCVYLN